MQNVAEGMVTDVGSFPSYVFPKHEKFALYFLVLSFICKTEIFLYSSNMSVVVLMKNAYKDVEDLHFYMNHEAIGKLQ